MASASKQYLNGIHKKFSFLATWFPNACIKLGDVGIQEGDQFKQMTTLDNLGVSFRVRGGTSPLDFAYTSESGVAVQTKAAGELSPGTSLPLAEAGIHIQFSSAGAFLFQAAGCIVDEIDDKDSLGKTVLLLARQGRWDENWAVVDTVVRAASATIVVSNSNAGSLDLTAKGPVSLANLASLDAGITVSSQSGDVVRFIAAKDLMPMFRLSRIKRSLFQQILGGPITFGGPGAEPAPVNEDEDNPLEEVSPE